MGSVWSKEYHPTFADWVDVHLHVRMCFKWPKFSIISYRDGERIYCCIDIDKDFNRHSPRRMKDKLRGCWDMCHQMLDGWANQGYPVPHDHLVIKICGKEIRSLSDVAKAQAMVEASRLKGLAGKNEMSVQEYLTRAEVFRKTLEGEFKKELPWPHLSNDMESAEPTQRRLNGTQSLEPMDEGQVP